MQLMKRVTFSAVSVLLLTMSSVPVAALSGSGDDGTTSTVTSSSTTDVKQEDAGSVQSSETVHVNNTTELHGKNKTLASTTTEHTASDASTRLDATKLKVCKKRETAINNTLGRIADRGQKHLDLFTTIAERTEKFYVSKGKTLSNYDALVTAVNAKKATAQAAVDTIKADSVTFKCDGTDPKGAAESFKAALKSEISALKEYRTAVKNLIVGVKSVQSTTEGSN